MAPPGQIRVHGQANKSIPSRKSIGRKISICLCFVELSSRIPVSRNPRVMANRNEAYSGLEVVTHANNSSDKYTYNSANYSTLESATSPRPPPFPEKQAFISGNNYDGLQSAGDLDNNRQELTPTSPRSSKKKKLIIGGIVAAVIVIAAIVGGVCGALLSKKSSNTSTNGSSNGTASGSSRSVQSRHLALSY